MSAVGSPGLHSATTTAHEAFQRLKDRTPDRDDEDDVPGTSSKTECELLRYQGWGGDDQSHVEKIRRRWIRKPWYWRLEIGWKLGMVTEHVSKAKLPQLHETTENLDLLLSSLGVLRDDIENARFRLPETQTEYWDEELEFRQGLKKEAERSNQSNGDDSQPAPLTHSSPLRKSPRPLAPRSINRRSPIKGVQGARVQKDNSTRRTRSTKASEQQEPPSAREEAPASGKGKMTITTLGEGAVPSAPASRGCVGKQKPADKPHHSAGVRKSARIKQNNTIPREYKLRTRTISAV